jgi:hypothetical protein
VVFVAAGAISPAFSATITKAKVKKITANQINNLVPGVIDRSGVPRFGSHRYDPSAKLSRGAQRSDQVKIVGGKQRRRNRFSQPPDDPHQGDSRG